MVKKIFGWLGLALLVLAGIVLVITLRAKPWPVSAAIATPYPMPHDAIQHMSQAVKLATISTSDTSAIDTATFKAFGTFLESAYPMVHKQLSKTRINQFSFVFEWKGQNAALPPIILMGHYDVVPVEAASINKWLVPPFSGTITDTCIWGRGAADDKSGVISIMEATEAMLGKGFVPQRTIYLCFGHNEEVSGSGARAIAAYLAEKNVHAEMVLDEGGEITEGKIKDVKRPVAVIGVAEKGYASFELTVQQEGGHSSMPAKETAIGILVAGLDKLKGKNPPSRLTPPTKEFLIRIGSSSNIFLNRMATANMWLFEGVTKGILADKPEGNAMIHTTIVPTILESGVKDNIVPGVAKAIINTRILTGETAKSVEAFIRATLNDDRIQVKKMGNIDSDPSPATAISSAAFKRIESAVNKTIPNVITAPYLMIGATDSRHYRSIADGVVNFLPMTDSKGFHGVNERLPLRDLQRGINFMMTVIEESNKEFK
ncbi:MAG: M20/M25/M40 family metallo-hydrolase [Chitinophagaceae bacterium]